MSAEGAPYRHLALERVGALGAVVSGVNLREPPKDEVLAELRRALAASGVLFTNAHCQAPICGPSTCGRGVVRSGRNGWSAGTALKADVVQYPEKIGRRAVEVVAAHLAGEAVEAIVPIEVGMVDQASLQAE